MDWSFMGMGTVRMSDEGWTYSLCTRQQERLVRGTQVKETSKSTEVLFCTPEIDYTIILGITVYRISFYFIDFLRKLITPGIWIPTSHDFLRKGSAGQNGYREYGFI